MLSPILPSPRLTEHCRTGERKNVRAGRCQGRGGVSMKCCFHDMTWLLHLELPAAVAACTGLGP